MTDAMWNVVTHLNAANRAYERLVAGPFPTGDLWLEHLETRVALVGHREHLSKVVAEVCAPWFDGSAFKSGAP